MLLLKHGRSTLPVLKIKLFLCNHRFHTPMGNRIFQGMLINLDLIFDLQLASSHSPIGKLKVSLMQIGNWSYCQKSRANSQPLKRWSIVSMLWSHKLHMGSRENQLFILPFMVLLLREKKKKKKVIFIFRCLISRYTCFFFHFPFNLSHTSKHWLGYLGDWVWKFDGCYTKRKKGNYQFQVCQYTYFLFFSPSMCLMHIQVKLYIVYDIYIVYLYTIYNSRSFFLQLRRCCHAGKMSI